MRRPTAFLVSALFALALLGAGPLGNAPVSALSTIAPTTTCANSEDNTGGLGLICEVTIVNTITPAGGSATVTVRECHGAAGDPEAACTTTPAVLTAPVTAVNQCNDSINGGGGTLRCSVQVTNNFVGLSPVVTAATVNQCVGSGESGVIGTSIICDPFPASTSGATITQCNGSANGETLVELRCTASGTTSSTDAVTINQCNGSANGGGALVICSANIDNNILPAATPSPTPVPAPTATASPAPGGTAAPTATPRPTAPNTSTAQLADGQSASALLVVSGLVFLSVLSLATVARRRTRST